MQLALEVAEDLADATRPLGAALASKRGPTTSSYGGPPPLVQACALFAAPEAGDVALLGSDGAVLVVPPAAGGAATQGRRGRDIQRPTAQLGSG